jgi:uncharacterized protein
VELTGHQLIPLSQEQTWQALNDPDLLKQCVPGCEAFEKVADNKYNLTMRAKIGPVSARFRGVMTLSQIDAPRGYKLVFEGQGGVAGFAKGEANVDLVPEGEATRLTYNAKALIGGKIAQLGARLIDGVARKMADDFFKAFNEHAARSVQKETPSC